MDASDAKLAERLQRDDPEQFHTLVRMHLSFVLDLNTDECDSVTEKVKSRALKWRFVPAPFTKKVKGTAKGVMEGAPLTQEGICQVYQLIEYLSKEENICQEGIFRRTGKLTRQHELKTLLNSGVSLELSKSQFSVHDCASVLKSFLAELPEPLLTDAHYPAYCQIAEMCDNPSNKAKLLRAIQLLLLLLPSENSILLKDVLQLLHLTASFESSNKMSADNLSTLFTPHLLCPRKLSPEAFHVNSQTMSGVVAFMIRQGTDLFSIPPNLATDIRAYWSEKERRLLSPQKELDKSISDGAAAAATVYTFVDRETTAKAYAINPTEAALAELYAHVQSLPESSNKRKLIKKYNKENGHGTPLQMQKNNQRGKSLGDSIKKHIFNKNLRRGKNSVEETQVECLSLEKYNETMMTPRSRKPVIALSGTNLCQLGNFSTWDGTVGSLSSSDSIGDAEGEDDVGNTYTNGHISKIADPIGGGFKLDPKLSTIGENSPREFEANQNESDGSNSEYCSADSLTSTFRSYLCSRSVLTASPVDLSFSSRAGDFDTGVSSCSDKVPSEGGLSESLLYCLDGNEPSLDTTGIGNDDSKCSMSIDVGVPTRKRSADTSLLNNNKHVDLYDQRIESKKCHIDKILSASALMPESKHKNRIHETSL